MTGISLGMLARGVPACADTGHAHVSGSVLRATLQGGEESARPRPTPGHRRLRGVQLSAVCVAQSSLQSPYPHGLVPQSQAHEALLGATAASPWVCAAELLPGDYTSGCPSKLP